MVNKQYVGEGHVVLISGGGKVYTDVAARFVRSERELEEILGSPYSKRLVENILSSGHRAATEFDWFVFGVEGYARVTEVQLVRKRLASYMIKSGRADKEGKRSFDVVLPRAIEGNVLDYRLSPEALRLPDGRPVLDFLPEGTGELLLRLDSDGLLDMLEAWYEGGVAAGYKEEELRYLKPQATEFKALIGMNAHALLDWFSIRCCRNAQTEIRDLANKMMALCKQAAPDLFADAGPNCVQLGYCPENKLQNPACRGKIPTKEEALALLRAHRATKRRVEAGEETRE